MIILMTMAEPLFNLKLGIACPYCKKIIRLAKFEKHLKTKHGETLFADFVDNSLSTTTNNVISLRLITTLSYGGLGEEGVAKYDIPVTVRNRTSTRRDRPVTRSNRMVFGSPIWTSRLDTSTDASTTNNSAFNRWINNE